MDLMNGGASSWEEGDWVRGGTDFRRGTQELGFGQVKWRWGRQRSAPRPPGSLFL